MRFSNGDPNRWSNALKGALVAGLAGATPPRKILSDLYQDAFKHGQERERERQQVEIEEMAIAYQDQGFVAGIDWCRGFLEGMAERVRDIPAAFDALSAAAATFKHERNRRNVIEEEAFAEVSHE